jgi:ACR3 family arsenite efflux pump ArsB
MKYYLLLMMGIALVLSVLVLMIKRRNRMTARSLSTKHTDFISAAAMVIGGIVLMDLLFGGITTLQSDDSLTKILQITIPIMLILFLVFYTYLAVSKNSNITNDERTEFSFTKSARNALLATNIAFFSFLVGSDDLTLTRSAIIIILACGYFVFLGSAVFYYYWKA